ncbi:MAG: porin family protein [Moraxellaceae bacterium]|nr:MAG: porin family protein [Moraxellaceae bacterium]
MDDLEDGVDNLSNIRAVEYFGGYKYNDALGIELRFGNGMKEGTSKNYFDAQGVIQSGKLKREIGSYESIYYKPELVNDEAKLYALLGYTHVNSSVKITDTSGALVSSSDDSASGYSYGIGIGFVINEHFNINIEYRNICDEISGKPNLVGLNIDYRF